DSGSAKSSGADAAQTDEGSAQVKNGTATAATAGMAGAVDSNAKQSAPDGAEDSVQPQKKTKTSASGKKDVASGAAKDHLTYENFFHGSEVEEAFDELKPGEVRYYETENGKVAYGKMEYTENPVRSQYNQRTAGGEERRPDDQGMHLFPAGAGGDPIKENHVAGNQNLNQGRLKSHEMEALDLSRDEKTEVIYYAEGYSSDGSERPDYIMSAYAVKHPDGSIETKDFSTPNESSATLDEWNAIADSMPYDDDIPNAMRDEHYDEIHRILEEEGY
ncbi:MAG: DNA/RNA non-specific endonuclease, partial [Clostridia bacterium]|nr:DNA/RNA non-specific endonuclease [Clostridia bacterium]